MKKKLLIILFAILLLLPFKTMALSKNYEDKVSEIVQNENKSKDKITLYLFHGKECPHCEEEREWLKTIKNKYKSYLEIKYYEVWHNEDNAEKMDKVREELKIKEEGVPLTIIGDKSFVGYSEAIGSSIENTIKNYIQKGTTNKIKIPILGKINTKKVSIPIVAIILGFIDGFNPCAMWILLFLINMLFNLKNRKKAWILGLAFLLVSGIIYFLSMIGIDFVVGITTIKLLKILIAAFILIAGILNLKKYFETRNKEAGCTVVDNKKRKKITTKMKQIINNNSFFLSLIGIIVLAASVNLIELACSLGFPVIFTEILNINHLEGFTKILYLLIYIFFYMIDDIAVFSISMITLESTGITNKYNKLCTLISGIIMIIMGLLLLYRPDWLMFNF